jgi:hypothetical protein
MAHYEESQDDNETPLAPPSIDAVFAHCDRIDRLLHLVLLECSALVHQTARLSPAVGDLSPAVHYTAELISLITESRQHTHRVRLESQSNSDSSPEAEAAMAEALRVTKALFEQAATVAPATEMPPEVKAQLDRAEKFALANDDA